MRLVKKLLALIVATFCVMIYALISSMVVDCGDGWYEGLLKPTFWIEGITESLIRDCILIIAIFAITLLISEGRRRGLLLFFLGALLSLLWCVTVFYAKDLAVGLIFGFATFSILLATMIESSKSAKTVAMLLLAILLWVFVVTIANVVLLCLNI